MANAWMIRNDGLIFEVSIHPYGSYDIEYIEETLWAAEWLYSHTAHTEIKHLIIDFISSYASLFDNNDELSKSDLLIDLIHKRSYKWLSEKFVRDHSDEINKGKNYEDLSSIDELINNELNQEFLRARYGGSYNSERSSKEMVFRISSSNFNWFNIIYEFTYDHRRLINSVTIIRDDPNEENESTLYYKYRGEVYNNMPIDDFITLSGNPVVESKNNPTPLEKGNSILTSIGNNKNFNIINNKFNLIKSTYINKNFV